MSSAMARGLLPRLEPYAPLFVEEPVRPEYGSHLPGLETGHRWRNPQWRLSDGGRAEW